MEPKCLGKEVLQLHMAALVGIFSRRGLGIEARRRNKPNKMLVLYKPLLSLQWSFKTIVRK